MGTEAGEQGSLTEKCQLKLTMFPCTHKNMGFHIVRHLFGNGITIPSQLRFNNSSFTGSTSQMVHSLRDAAEH